MLRAVLAEAFPHPATAWPWPTFAVNIVAAFLLGSNNAVVMQYRFAATEYVDAGRASRAIAVVMTGALVAAWLGPDVAVRAADLVPGSHYAGSFVAGAGGAICSIKA